MVTLGESRYYVKNAKTVKKNLINNFKICAGSVVEI